MKRAALLACALTLTIAFGMPARAVTAGARPQISADGTAIAYAATRGGDSGIWVRTVGRRDDRLVARELGAVRDLVWQADSRHILYRLERSGEGERLFRVDLVSRTPRDVLPPDVGSPTILAISDDLPDTILVKAFAADGAGPNVYRVDLRAGTAAIDTENPGRAVDYLADAALHVKAATLATPEGATAVLVRPDGGAWRELVRFTREDGNSEVQSISPDGTELYAITAQGWPTSRLLRYHIVTRRALVVARDSAHDLSGVLIDRGTHAPVATRVADEHGDWKVIDAGWEADFDALRARACDNFDVTSMSHDAGRMLIACDGATGARYYVYDRHAKNAALLDLLS